MILSALFVIFIVFPLPAQQRGKASFYSKHSTGTRTASGERLHRDSLVCAHRFYPFGTRLKVTNLNNGRSVIVRVIDRGPYGHGRIIDLSWAAAKQIGMIGRGIATVRVEVVQNPVPFRSADDLNLPDMDFEVAEDGYSFIEHWKKAKTITEEEKKAQRKSEERHLRPKGLSTKHATKEKAVNKSEKNQDLQKKDSKKDDLYKKSEDLPRKETPNRWGNVFEKLKNWGNHLLK